jgi:hypothetical protein
MLRSAKILLFLIFVARVKCHEVLMDILNFANLKGVSAECSSDLKLLKSAIEKHEIWAMKIRDSSGKSSSDFFGGNNFWLGSSNACERMNNPKLIHLSPTKTRRHHQNITAISSKFPVEYRMVYASHESPIQFDTECYDFVGLQIGICYPKSCGPEDTKQILDRVFSSGEFQKTEIYGKVKLMKTKSLKLRENFFSDVFAKIFV